MNSPLSEFIEIVEPDLPSALFSESATSAVKDILPCMAPVFRLGFECRLLGNSQQVDLSQGILQREGEDRTVSEFLARVRGSADTPRHRALKRLDDFCQSWTDPSHVWHRDISEIWLEYDLVDTSQEEQVPSVFIGLDPISGRSSLCALTIDVLEHLRGKRLMKETQTNLQNCFQALPSAASICHAGVMLSRTSDAVRINVKQLQPIDTSEYLKAIGWTGDWNRCLRIFKDVLSMCEEFRLALDVGPAVHAKIGFEFYQTGAPHQVSNWAEFLEYLVKLKLCSNDKRDALLSWPGYYAPPTTEVAWPAALTLESLARKEDQFGILARTLNHVKITFRPEKEPEAKAYLFFGHTWISTGIENIPNDDER